ncbi:hypothetical protein SCG7086_AH_00040 [Chlamydiales bacterium SCGC AG-110-P3]|nr:hypothetical protein SCG7086_AH_00040 [Chlamydiales bacterium SCGC AG-110-P3]
MAKVYRARYSICSYFVAKDRFAVLPLSIPSLILSSLHGRGYDLPGLRPL